MDQCVCSGFALKKKKILKTSNSKKKKSRNKIHFWIVFAEELGRRLPTLAVESCRAQRLRSPTPQLHGLCESVPLSTKCHEQVYLQLDLRAI